MARAAKTTTDREEIQRWVEARGGYPAHVKRTATRSDPGVLRIDYPGFSGQRSLEPISWDEFFEWFDRNNLAFLYQDTPRSRFSKLVDRGTVAARERGDDKASKKSASKKSRSATRGSASTRNSSAAGTSRSSVASSRGTSTGRRSAATKRSRAGATTKKSSGSSRRSSPASGASRTTRTKSSARAQTSARSERTARSQSRRNTPSKATGGRTDRVLDINTASEKELTRVFQIDGKRASRLVRERPFRTWEEVKEVPGFEDGMVENIREAGGRLR